MRRVANFFCAFLLSAISVNVFATTDTGYQWLTAQQQADGSFSTNTDIAINYQATFEALKLKSLASTFSINQTSAKSFLVAVPYNDTESLAQRLINGVTTDSSGANIAQLLIANQNTDGGFGDDVNFQSTPFDTVWAVTALSTANQLNDLQRASAINYLLSKQLSSGAWAYQGDPSILVTSRVVSWLAAQNSSSANAALSRATTFLTGQIKSNGLILGDVFNSAHVLSALSVSGNATIAKPLVDGLLSAQLSNGSWASDAYTTALVLQSLKLWQSTSNVLPAGKVSGRVVIAGSTQAISGATISVAGQTNFSVTSDSSGFFTLSGLSTGTYNLIVSANGYVSTTRGVDLGETAKDIGDVPLQSGANKALLTGKIFDSATGNALSGATVQLTGSTNYQVTTGSDGQFALAGIDTDDYQVTISATGYHSYQHSIDLNDAQQYRLIQGLVSFTTVLNNANATISGRVVDGATQLAIANANVQINGNAIQTDSSGHFAFTDIERNTYQVAVNATNYTSSEFSYGFVAGSNGNVGDIPLYLVTTNNAVTDKTISVKIIDAITHDVLSNAAVSVAENNQTQSTNAQGVAVFTITNLTLATISATKAGYMPASTSVQTTNNGSYAVTLVLTPGVPAATTTTLSGTVTDATTHNPVANTQVTIVGTNFTATTDAAGHYTISGINQLSFTVKALVNGYATWQQSIQVQQFGAYTLNIQLISGTTLFRVNSINVPNNIIANKQVTFSAEIENLGATSDAVVVRGYIYSSEGELVATVLPRSQISSIAFNVVSIPPSQKSTFDFYWLTQQRQAGVYSLRIDVVENNSVNQTNPVGNVYSSSSTTFAITESKALEGGFNFDPALSQAGQTTPVTLNTIIRNVGNTVLSAGDYRLIISTSSNIVAHTSAVTVPELAINQLENINFGQWYPSSPGNFKLTLLKLGDPDVAPLSGTYYVGSVATGTFVLDQNVFSAGNQNTSAHINVNGIDALQAQLVDQLYAMTKTSAKSAYNSLGTNITNWQSGGPLFSDANSHACLACHVHPVGVQAIAASIASPNAGNAFKWSIRTTQLNNGVYASSYDQVMPKTQTYLSAWGLSEAKNIEEQEKSLPQQMKALNYIWQTKNENTATNSITWQSDDNTGCAWRTANAKGWMSAEAAMTSVVAQTISNMFTSTAQLVSPTQNYTIANTRNLDGTLLSPLGTYKLGNILYIAKKGGIEKFNLLTNTSLGKAYTDNANRQLNDVAVLSDGTMYATVNGVASVLKISSTGVLQSTINIPNAGYDIINWNGGLYVSTFSGNRLLRVNFDGTSQIVYDAVSSGYMYLYTRGLAISADDSMLYISDWGGNVQTIDKQHHFQLVNWWYSYSPMQIATRASGGFWVAMEPRALYGGTTPNSGLAIIYPDNSIYGVFRDDTSSSSSTISGMFEYNGNLMYVNNVTNKLVTVNASNVDTTLLTTIHNKVDAIVNGQLAKAYINESEIINMAFRLITMSELLPYINDSTLKTNTTAAITYLDTQLRARQNADGGWPALTGGATSNTTVTAWVGIALDYAKPKASDQAIRKAVTYLLNTQQPDGSWKPDGKYFVVASNNISVTALIMSYLPRATQLLGGIDVELDVKSRTDVTLTSPSLVPNSTITHGDGSYTYHWAINSLSGAAQAINLNVGINNLLAGETRPVAESATLSFKNAFSSEVLTRPITIPTVSAINGVSINTITNQSSYGASQDVIITNTISNGSTAITNGTVKTIVRTSEGGTIETLPDLTGINVAQNGSVTVPEQWSTGNIIAGNYQVFTQFVDGSGMVRAEHTTNFTITPTSTGSNDGITYGTQISTDKISYLPFDRVDVLARVRNMTTNASNDSVLAKIKVTAPNGDTFFSDNWVIDSMAANGLLDHHYPLSLQDAAAGTYTATIQLWNADLTQLIVSSSYQFSVRNDASAQLTALNGSVSATHISVNRGDAQSCTDTINNRSQNAVTANIVKILVNADTQTVISTSTQSLTLAASASDVSVRNVSTSTLVEGNYTCILQAQMGESVSTLGFASFAVTVPPINVDEKITQGKHGRLLVLIDDVTTKDALDKTSMSTQKTYLQQLLNTSGWSYTIVDNATAFKRELYSAQYATVALLSNNVTLSPEVNAFIVEAVNNGLGLVESGAFNRRNSAQEKALGIYLTGRQQQATGILIPQGALGANWSATTINPANKLDIDRCSGDVLATYTGVTKQKNDNSSTCVNDTGAESALVSSTYGQGRSVFAAFDVLDEATASAQATNAYASILTFALDKVSPQPIIAAGKAVPQTITLTNQGVATDVRLRLSNAPQGNIVASSGNWTWVETNATTHAGEWQLVEHLDVNEVFATTVYVQLIDGSEVTLPLTIETRTDANAAWAAYKQDTITITPTVTAPVIADVVSELNALEATYPADKNIQQANTALKQANSFVVSGDKQQALNFMLKAADLLSASSNATNTRLKLDALIINWVRSL